MDSARWAALIAVFLLLSACTSVTPLTVGADMAAETPPQLAASVRRGEVATYRTADGRELAYRAYRADDRAASTATALVYLHGIESHGVWFALAADGLSRRGHDVFLLDRRGSGLNRENRGFLSGDAPGDVDGLLADVDAFLDSLRGRYQRVVLVGLSWGGKLALAETLADSAAVDALILITPGLVPEVGYGALEQVGIAAAALVRPEAAFRTPIAPEMFTKTPVWLAFIETDPLRLRQVTARFLMATRALDRRIARGAAERGTPTLLILAGRDRIVDNAGARMLLARGPGDLAIVTYPDQTHSVQLDDVDRLVADMDAWLRADGWQR